MELSGLTEERREDYKPTDQVGSTGSSRRQGLQNTDVRKEIV